MKYVILMALALSSFAAEIRKPVPTLREQAAIQQQWLKMRLERVLPALMRKHNVPMWVVVCREYNEDPVYFSLVSPDVFAARRRTIYVFTENERLALGGGTNGGLYKSFRPANAELYGDNQWAVLRKLIEERNPARIAINISRTHAFSDGLSAGEYEALQEALGLELSKRLVRSEELALEYIETRLPEMLPAYRSMMETVHAIIATAFSNEVITPGKTTTDDVVWWLRQKVNDLGLGTWFQPTVDVQRTTRVPEGPVVIQRGDVLHVDFGITAMRLNTDTQHMAYVLREGETEAPAGLKKALANGNRLQDIVVASLKTGQMGNEVLAASLAAMRAAGIKGSVYSHPVGDHGHAAGPLIGLWDRQDSVPGRGDVRVLPDTWYSIELSASTPVEEWGGAEVRMALEEDVAIDREGVVRWVLKRQTDFHLIR